MMNLKFKKSIHLLLIILTIIVIISGLGIAYYQIVSALTLGLLDKTMSFKVHSYIFIPFLIILLLHSSMSWILKNLKK